MKLSRNFNLQEFLVSQTAVRHGIDMTPDDTTIENLTKLARKVLQPIRDDLRDSIRISSGYRPAELNRRIGGSPTSDHILGCAADITTPEESAHELAERIRKLIADTDLPVKQLIHEFGAWVHVSTWPASAADGTPQLLTAYKSAAGRTTYAPGIFRVDSKTRGLA